MEGGREKIWCEKHKLWYEDIQTEIFGSIFRSKFPECIDEFEIGEKKTYAERVEQYKKYNIEQEFYDATFQTFHATTDTLKAAIDSVQTLVKNKTGKILLLGKNGTGKTHLACSAVKELGGKIMTMFEISATIRASYTHLAKEPELDILNELARIPLLVIDEIGRTKGSDTEENWLSYLIDKRHVRKLPLIMISNKHLRKTCPEGKGCKDCLENYLSEDMMSRLSEDGKRIQFDGEDYRKRNRV